MWETLRNAWRVEDLRKKLLYTLFMLLIYRLLSVIPVPGIDVASIQAASENYDMLGMINMMTGNAFSQMTVMAMGITPYINASIIMQLLTIAIPALERLQKEGGEEGKQKIARITRYVTVGLAFLQAIGLVNGLNGMKPEYQNFFGNVTIGLTMAGGTAFAMWVGERITKNGVGNGISLLIFAGIISNLFNGIVTSGAYVLGITQTAASTTASGAAAGPSMGQFIVMIVATLAIVVIVTFVDMGERRVPVQYAKRVVGRKMYGGQSTYIPFKVSSTGVLPLIFAYSFMAFPGTILAMFGKDNPLNVWWQANMSQISPLYLSITALLILAFTYFYSSISFNPEDIAKNINQQGGNIPGTRSGRPTVDFLKRVSRRLTLFEALFLAFLATLPSLLLVGFNTQVPFAASSILIAVSVALETTRQVESQLVMRHYKGFL